MTLISDSDIPIFKPGSKFTAEQYNKVLDKAEKIASTHGISFHPLKRYSTGDKLTAQDVNKLLDNIEKSFKQINKTVHKWSFGHYKTGDRFTAENMNEIVDSIKVLEAI